MALRFFLILGIILLTIFGLHYILYRNWIYLFGISDFKIKLVLLPTLSVLSVSFITSFFLLFWQKNSVTVGFYIFAASWFATFINLLLALIVIRLILLVSGFLNYRPNVELLAAICFIGAILLSAYGFWRAFHPINRYVQVRVRNVSENWKGKKIVFLSDLHIGYVHRARFLKRVVKQANKLDPEIILITGDLFDGMGRDPEPFVAALNQFKAKRGVYFVTGNHEGYVGLSQSLAIIGQTHFNILHNEMVDIDGLQLVGVSYPGVEDLNEIRHLKESRANPTNENSRILLFHTPTNIDTKPNGLASQQYNAYWGPDTSMSLNRSIDADLQLSGHTHAGQFFPFTLLTRLIFKGYHYGLHQEDGFSIYITSGVGTWGPPMRTGSAPEIVVLELVPESTSKNPN